MHEAVTVLILSDEINIKTGTSSKVPQSNESWRVKKANRLTPNQLEKMFLPVPLMVTLLMEVPALKMSIQWTSLALAAWVRMMMQARVNPLLILMIYKRRLLSLLVD